MNDKKLFKLSSSTSSHKGGNPHPEGCSCSVCNEVYRLKYLKYKQKYIQYKNQNHFN